MVDLDELERKCSETPVIITDKWNMLYPIEDMRTIIAELRAARDLIATLRNEIGYMEFTSIREHLKLALVDYDATTATKGDG